MLMHPKKSAEELIARYPNLPKEYAVFMASLFSETQAKISEFRASQIQRTLDDANVWQADLVLAEAASNLQGFMADIVDKKFKVECT